MKKSVAPRNYPALIGYFMGMLGVFIWISLTSTRPKEIVHVDISTIVMLAVLTCMIPLYIYMLRRYRKAMAHRS